MKIKVLEKGKNKVKLEFVGADESTMYVLTQKLMEDSKVVNAKYTIRHPLADNPVLYVETSDTRPINAIKRAAKAIRAEFEDALKNLEG